jgi:carboxyl-terminal processing protease
MSQPHRSVPVLAVLVLLVGGLAGGWIGDRARAESAPPDDKLWTFNEVMVLVKDQYVGEVDSKRLVENAIGGMLTTLDPHSNYLDPDSFSEMRDEQRGRFHGLGIQITKRGPDKPLTIIAPIDGTPASRAGLLSGDIISEIEGEPTIDLTVQDAVRRLKGDKGTKVTITIQRPGRAEPFEVTIERDEIPIQSVRVAYVLEPDVGVIRIANFTTTTADELDEAIDRLREQGMKRILLDLRANPGGLLDQAVEVAQRFIAPDKLIVYTQGRISGSNQRFVARKVRTRAEEPLVVLVDRSSASASEIVAGAVQDHDRGLVVGETTFGKGLVQRVIPIQVSGGGALAVTTAKYYTPSGRLIQRDYSDLDDYYLTAQEADETEGWRREDLPETTEGREVFRTEAGRKVYGGGGITPDYIVKSPKIPDVVFRLRRDNLFFDFGVAYVAAHPELERGFRVDAALMEEFFRFLRTHPSAPSEIELQEARRDVELSLRAQIVRLRWDQVEEARVFAEQDPQMQRALDLFDEAERLTHAGADGDGRLRAEIRR